MGGDRHVEVSQRGLAVEEMALQPCRPQVLNSSSPHWRQPLCRDDERTSREQGTLGSYGSAIRDMETTLGASYCMFQNKRRAVASFSP